MSASSWPAARSSSEIPVARNGAGQLVGVRGGGGGLASEIGTIEPGKSADIIAVDGDPLTDVAVLKNVGFVMARGEVIK